MKDALSGHFLGFGQSVFIEEGNQVMELSMRFDSTNRALGRSHGWSKLSDSGLLERWDRTEIPISEASAVKKGPALPLTAFAANAHEFSLGADALAGMCDKSTTSPNPESMGLACFAQFALWSLGGLYPRLRKAWVSLLFLEGSIAYHVEKKKNVSRCSRRSMVA